jgi:SAM-dependent methyltransferase
MGLGIGIIETLSRERRYRGLGDDVLLIGRQTVYCTPREALEKCAEFAIDVGDLHVDDIEVDQTTTNKKPGFESERLISDVALLRLLGATNVRALDRSSYENAEIIHDLNLPLPDGLKGCADLVLDGSTLDNVFNPATAIKNFAELLRPGGRLITGNTYSNDFFPHTMVTPLWLLDYFVVNAFIDCKVYIIVYPNYSSAAHEGEADVFTINLDSLMDPNSSVSQFVSPHVMSTFVIAEKGPRSTSDRIPSQGHYRSPDELAIYRQNLAVIRESDRPHIMRSTGKIHFHKVPGGHLFIADDFTARDPHTEISRLR